ncbi:hypothetical protein DERF_005909 [Dermatophagoides farinae]|uniref:Uncharacterized protein n=1 Tax=Dermatophagoides farinae TaxID=6954 RepID=A0A922L6N4_DERFA|nr:hypothetical protein DERF_005909 [Dermatophagoides farinae]
MNKILHPSSSSSSSLIFENLNDSNSNDNSNSKKKKIESSSTSSFVEEFFFMKQKQKSLKNFRSDWKRGRDFIQASLDYDYYTLIGCSNALSMFELVLKNI